MPELLPSLLDRLGRPESHGSGSRRGVSEAQLVESVLRDLTWLLNHTHLEALEPELAEHPLARASVLNFGIRPLTGRITGDGWDASLAHSVQSAIQRYEPRLRNPTVTVRKSTTGSSGGPEPTRTVVELVIEADLYTQSFDVPLRLLGRLDPDDGSVALGPGA